MIRKDEDALNCDFAETYSIYDYRVLPLRKAALYAVGLRENSRIKLKMQEMKYDVQTLLMAAMLDALNLEHWFRTSKENVRPTSVLRKLLGEPDEEDSEKETFYSAEEFENRRKEIIDARSKQ